jgi:hypothetical protein
MRPTSQSSACLARLKGATRHNYHFIAAYAAVRVRLVEYTENQRLLHYPHTHLDGYRVRITPTFEGMEIRRTWECQIREYTDYM